MAGHRRGAADGRTHGKERWAAESCRAGRGGWDESRWEGGWLAAGTVFWPAAANGRILCGRLQACEYGCVQTMGCLPEATAGCIQLPLTAWPWGHPLRSPTRALLPAPLRQVGIYLPLYDALLSELQQRQVGWSAPLWAGTAARTATVLCTAPLELVRTRLQAAHLLSDGRPGAHPAGGGLAHLGLQLPRCCAADMLV